MFYQLLCSCFPLCFPHNLRDTLLEVRPTVALEGEDLVNSYFSLVSYSKAAGNSAYELSRTHFRAHSPSCPSEAELLLNFYLLPSTIQPFCRLW